jgi:peptidoglycan-N-acetylglucosamine deacetylase
MIPLLITVDLEVAQDYDLNEQKLILHKIFSDLNSMGIPVTVFTTSEIVNIFPEQIKMIHASKNEIGCHGLYHGKEENYKKASEKEISGNIIVASKNIEDKIQEKPICFRGPFMSTSSITQSVLIKNGYLADFSVCSQRFDIFNSKGGNIGWLLAPRLPYRSSERSPFKKGNLPIWNIPLSCIGLPFISGLLYLFGMKFMKKIFRLLLKESLKTQKPIVYLFHSYEFTNYVGFKKDCNKNTEIKRPKKSFIHKFYISDPIKRYNMNIDFLKYMLTFNSISPITGKTYIKMLNGDII